MGLLLLLLHDVVMTLIFDGKVSFMFVFAEVTTPDAFQKFESGNCFILHHKHKNIHGSAANFAIATYIDIH